MPAPAQNPRPTQQQAKPAGQAVAVAGPQGPLVIAMAATYGMDPDGFEKTLLKTVMPDNCSREEMAAFLVVAREHNLNPFKKEIYAFKSKGGGIVPIVSIDGWITIINRHPAFAGVDFEDHRDPDGNLFAITCNIHRNDRASPISITEYMSECARPTEPWKQWPNRFLRHRSLIQCGRVAFGLGGIFDPDEGEGMVDITPTAAPPAPQRSNWRDDGRKADQGYGNGGDQADRGRATQGNGNHRDAPSQGDAPQGDLLSPAAGFANKLQAQFTAAKDTNDLSRVYAENRAHIEALEPDLREAVEASFDEAGRAFG